MVGRRVHVQDLVRTLVVVDATEFVEGSLLSAQVVLWWRGGFCVQNTVHSFMAAVLLGLAWLDELGDDTQANPPGRELRETGDGVAGEGVPVVGADALGQTVLAEEVTELPDGLLEVQAQHSVALEQEASVAVLDGKRVAEFAVQIAELSLEIGRPGRIGLFGDR